MTSDRTARSILGDVRADELGRTDSHDHLFFQSPALVGHELDDAASALREAAALATDGWRTLVQWTPAGIGRQLERLETVSRTTGLIVIAATGRHRRVHYQDSHPASSASVEALTHRFVHDIEVNRCGLIKVASGFWNIDSFESDSLAAAAAAHHETGVPIAVHLELGTAGEDVAQRLISAGVPVTSIILGHLGRNPDVDYAERIAQIGVFLCFDGPSLDNHQTDWRLVSLVRGLCNAGHGRQILIGADTTTSAATVGGGGAGAAANLRRLSSSLAQIIGREQLERSTTANPANAFAFEQR